MSYYGWKPYVSAAERRKKAEKAAAKATKSGARLSPVTASRGAIAKTFWGKAWCDNLERYSDYANRLPRGRTYVRNGSVIDLKIIEGEVHAQVMGSSLYQVAVSVVAVPKKQWQSISADCAGSIDSLVELLQGRLSKAVMQRICTPNKGLFPTPKEIQFECSCPDWAFMCKHVAAALYGVGARLDEQPELLFRLRRVDAKDLITQAGTGLSKTGSGPTVAKVLDEGLLGEVFGIEMAELAPVTERITRRAKSPAGKTPNKVTKVANARDGRAPKVGKVEATAKTVRVKKAVKAKPPTPSLRSTRRSPTSRTKTGATTAVPERKTATRQTTSNLSIAG